MNRAYFAFAALALASCATTIREHFWSVREVVHSRQSLAGTTITIRGWVEDCEYLSCVLYDSAEEARRARDPDRPPPPGDEHRIGYYLSVGGYPGLTGKLLHTPAEGHGREAGATGSMLS